ncbi:alpha/beta hydrolase, partial [Methylobacterium sp. J-088]|nr:alpha/beta hydrolase [Methylobacterium sp. J-088]
PRRGACASARCVRGAEDDPVLPQSLTDRLGRTFSDLDLAPCPGVGHFPKREEPERAAEEIAAFFERIGWV